MILLRLTFVLCIVQISAVHGATPLPQQRSSSEIELALKKLGVMGRVLHVAAHPDDENTRLISYWSNGALYDAAYLSLTRGGGGQNLIGPQLGEALGLIRTQELLAARRIDGGKQFFTRARDFGFSKSSEETMKIWGHEDVLSDVVWVIRKFRPDAIVTRFSPQPSRTQGHHTASAQLALEAFDLAADPNAFPKQLKYVDTWQAKRIVWNVSGFFFRAQGRAFDTTGLVPVEVGDYNAYLGKSYGEIASASRTMHKSQGFGSAISRGNNTEYFRLLKGSPLENSVIDEIDKSWSRFDGGDEIETEIQEIRTSFETSDPSASVAGLLELRRRIVALPQNSRITSKISDLDQIIASCLGLHAEALNDSPVANPGEALDLRIQVINRSQVPVALKAIKSPKTGKNDTLHQALETNRITENAFQLDLSESKSISQPHWLNQSGSKGRYEVAHQMNIGLPEKSATPEVELELVIEDTSLTYSILVEFKTVSPVKGESREKVEVAPAAFVEFSSPMYLFSNDKSKSIQVKVSTNENSMQGTLRLSAPKGWQIRPKERELILEKNNDGLFADFLVTPPSESTVGVLEAVFESSNRKYNRGRTVIEYDHIPKQTLFPLAQSRIVSESIKKKGNLVGYLEGAGDAIPQSLREIGYQVEMLGSEDMNEQDLNRFDTIILGIRAYNTVDNLDNYLPSLFQYAENGGTLIAQYNTNRSLKAQQLAPYPLRLSRDRITDESAPVSIVQPDHPALLSPNRITQTDFEGWIQERGLYFPDRWDEAFVPLLSSSDPGESPKTGGLLVAKYGDGYFVYTGYSWFRQLPAGVPGAYRLFANLVSLGN